MILRFTEFALDLDRHELLHHDTPVAIEPQVFDLLRVLAENAGSLVTKDQLIDQVWKGRIVSEATISARINAARVAVGDNGKDQIIIRTVPRRGFELVASVSKHSNNRQPGNRQKLQTIRYAHSNDGTNIAWSSAGKGNPVLLAWHHLSHLEKDWNSELIGSLFENLSGDHRLLRYDIRGTGLSDPLNTNDQFDQHVNDLLAVANDAKLERFPIIAFLQGAAVAIRFAARNPDRVSRLILANSYARGRAIRPGASEVPEHDPFIALLKSGGWGDPENGFMRAWATMVIPQASHSEITRFIELIANANTTEDSILQRELIDHLDVSNDLVAVSCPTLVIHARLCSIHPVQEGRRVAAGIPDAEFIEVDSANTVCVSSDPTFEQQLHAIREFLHRKPE